MTKIFHIKSITGETWKQFQTRFKYTEDEIYNNISYKKFIAVVVELCDNVGAYNKSEIYIFDSFIDANKLLNAQMYSSNAVNVYEVDLDRNSYTSVIEKYYDAFSYGRLAGIDAHNIELLNWYRKVYDLEEVDVYIH